MATPSLNRSTQLNPRIEWIDIAKAYGIIAIVLGHILTGTPIAHFLYWWHVPLFFILSGIFIKPLNNRHAWHRFFLRRVRNELILYSLMGVLLIWGYTLIHHESHTFLVNHLVDLIYGGRTLNFYTSTFWFINAYILTTIVITILVSVIHSRIIAGALVTSGLFLGASYNQVTWMHINGFAMTPWSADTVLITAFYSYVGYVLFHTNQSWIEDPKAISGIIVMAMTLILIHLNGGFTFRLSLKSHLIQSSLPNAMALIIIPTILALGVMVGALITSKLPFKFGLPLIGRHTLAIMYGHKMILDVCGLIGIKNPLFQLLLGICIPVIIVVACEKIRSLDGHLLNRNSGHGYLK